MNLQIIENRCRICATELTDLTCLIPIFPNDASNFFLLSKIHKYLYINIQEDDSLPKSLCATCFIKIESIDKFAYSAMKNQECFVSWLQNNQRQANTVTQTTIEMSTNSDFSFSNIIIKNECPQNEQRQQIFFQPHKTPRNPRHTDHITLEQIINDQIIKNPKIPAATSITAVFEQEKPTKRQRRQSQKSESKISTVSYNNLQIGELIKDYELLMLILKALKWEEYDRKATYEELIKRLKKSNCRDILSNKNLLNDNDVMQLIRCYVVANDTEMTNHNKTSPIPSNFLQQSTGDFSSHNKKVPVNVKIPTIKHPYNDDNSVTSMEVPIDPGLFLPYEEVTIDDDDEETVSATETKIETEKMKIMLPLKIETQTLSNKEVIVESNTTNEIQKQDPIEARSNGKYICSSCPEEFSSNNDLQTHVLTHFISKTTRASMAPKMEVSTHQGTPKKKKDKMRDLRRKKIAIRIKLSPKKINIKAKAKVPARFPCPICFDKQLSSKRNVNLHLESTHKVNGKYRCNGNECKKVFMKLENLLKHKTIHNNSMKQKQQVVKPSSSVAVYQCPYCVKSYTTSANRILHQKKMHADKEKNEK